MANYNLLPAVMVQAVVETVEEMAFSELTLYEGEPEIGQLNGSFRQAWLLVYQQLAGIFSLTLSPNLLREFAANIYGMDQSEISTEMENDTLAELLNTISGRIMREIIPEDQRYELGLPNIFLDPAILKSRTSFNCCFESEGEYLSFRFIDQDSFPGMSEMEGVPDGKNRGFNC